MPVLQVFYVSVYKNICKEIETIILKLKNKKKFIGKKNFNKKTLVRKLVKNCRQKNFDITALMRKYLCQKNFMT